MKKILALLLALLMLSCLFAGCSEKDQDDDDEPKTSANAKVEEDKDEVEDEDNEQSHEQKDTDDAEPEENNDQQNASAASGDILDAPEVTYNSTSNTMYIYYTYPGDTENGTASMELAVDQVTDDMYVLYMSDGLLKLHETLYEVSDAGITKYYKDSLMANFAQETAMSQAELQAEHDSVLSLLGYFMMTSDDYAGFQYRKSDEKVATLTGDVYVYDILNSGEVTGQVWIDQSTGLMVCMKDEQGNNLLSVQNFSLTNSGIPAYK